MSAASDPAPSTRRGARRCASPARRCIATASIEVRYPYTGEVVATVPKATVDDVRRALSHREANTGRSSRGTSATGS